MDMLVNLYAMPAREDSPELVRQGIRVVRAISPDRLAVLDFVEKEFGKAWAGECAAAFANSPVSCFIAVHKRRVVGFACYDATARGFFGPIGVSEEVRVCGVGGALLRRCLAAMRGEGYGYAIIGGGSGVHGFYEKEAGAVLIPGSDPGIYERLISYEPEEKK